MTDSGNHRVVVLRLVDAGAVMPTPPVRGGEEYSLEEVVNLQLGDGVGGGEAWRLLYPQDARRNGNFVFVADTGNDRVKTASTAWGSFASPAVEAVSVQRWNVVPETGGWAGVTIVGGSIHATATPTSEEDHPAHPDPRSNPIVPKPTGLAIAPCRACGLTGGDMLFVVCERGLLRLPADPAFRNYVELILPAQHAGVWRPHMSGSGVEVHGRTAYLSFAKAGGGGRTPAALGFVAAITLPERNLDEVQGGANATRHEPVADNLTEITALEAAVVAGNFAADSRGAGLHQLDEPHSVLVRQGALYVSDRYNNRIVRFQLAGGVCESEDPCAVWNPDGTENVGNACHAPPGERHLCTCGHPSSALSRTTRSGMQFESCKVCSSSEIPIWDYDANQVVCRTSASGSSAERLSSSQTDPPYGLDFLQPYPADGLGPGAALLTARGSASLNGAAPAVLRKTIPASEPHAAATCPTLTMLPEIFLRMGPTSGPPTAAALQKISEPLTLAGTSTAGAAPTHRFLTVRMALRQGVAPGELAAQPVYILRADGMGMVEVAPGMQMSQTSVIMLSYEGDYVLKLLFNSGVTFPDAPEAASLNTLFAHPDPRRLLHLDLVIETRDAARESIETLTGTITTGHVASARVYVNGMLLLSIPSVLLSEPFATPLTRLQLWHDATYHPSGADRCSQCRTAAGQADFETSCVGCFEWWQRHYGVGDLNGGEVQFIRSNEEVSTWSRCGSFQPPCTHHASQRAEGDLCAAGSGSTGAGYFQGSSEEINTEVLEFGFAPGTHIERPDVWEMDMFHGWMVTLEWNFWTVKAQLQLGVEATCDTGGYSDQYGNRANPGTAEIHFTGNPRPRSCEFLVVLEGATPASRGANTPRLVLSYLPGWRIAVEYLASSGKPVQVWSAALPLAMRNHVDPDTTIIHLDIVFSVPPNDATALGSLDVYATPSGSLFRETLISETGVERGPLTGWPEDARVLAEPTYFEVYDSLENWDAHGAALDGAGWELYWRKYAAFVTRDSSDAVKFVFTKSRPALFPECNAPPGTLHSTAAAPTLVDAPHTPSSVGAPYWRALDGSAGPFWRGDALVVLPQASSTTPLVQSFDGGFGIAVHATPGLHEDAVLYVALRAQHVVLRIHISPATGRELVTIAKRIRQIGRRGESGNSGILLHRPNDVARVASFVFVCDGENDRVQRWDEREMQWSTSVFSERQPTDGTPAKLLTGGTTVASVTDGYPKFRGIAVSADGWLYVRNKDEIHRWPAFGPAMDYPAAGQVIVTAADGLLQNIGTFEFQGLDVVGGVLYCADVKADSSNVVKIDIYNAAAGNPAEGHESLVFDNYAETLGVRVRQGSLIMTWNDGSVRRRSLGSDICATDDPCRASQPGNLCLPSSLTGGPHRCVCHHPEYRLSYGEGFTPADEGSRSSVSRFELCLARSEACGDFSWWDYHAVRGAIDFPVQRNTTENYLDVFADYANLTDQVNAGRIQASLRTKSRFVGELVAEIPALESSLSTDFTENAVFTEEKFEVLTANGGVWDARLWGPEQFREALLNSLDQEPWHVLTMKLSIRLGEDPKYCQAQEGYALTGDRCDLFHVKMNHSDEQGMGTETVLQLAMENNRGIRLVYRTSLAGALDSVDTTARLVPSDAPPEALREDRIIRPLQQGKLRHSPCCRSRQQSSTWIS